MARISLTCSPSSSSSSAIWNRRAARGSRVWNRWPKPGGVDLRADAVVHHRLGRFLHRLAAADHRQPAVEEAHARLDVAAVVRAERQNARRDASP
jgi:hypothetical protein